MFFKRFKWAWATIFILQIGVGITACGLRIGEQPAKNPEIDLGNKLGCLSKVDIVTAKFLNAELSDDEAENFVDCMIFSVTSFERYTQGSEEESYQPKELRNFFQRFFLENRIISDSLLTQLMKIKVVLVGGDEGKVTKKEFQKFAAILNKWKQDIVLMNRYMRVYNLSLKLSSEIADVSVYAAVQSLKSVARSFSEPLSSSEVGYHLEDFKIFLIEMQKFLNWDHYYPEARPVKAWGDLLSSFKSISVGGSDKTIHSGEWGELFGAVADWYSVLIIYQHQIKHRSLLRGESLKNFISFSREIVELGEKAVKSQFTKTIDFAKTDALLYAIEDLNLMPLGLTAEGLAQTSRPLFTRVLGNIEEAPEKRTAKGITRYHLAQLEDQLDRWIDIQMVLSESFHSPPMVTPQGIDSENLINPLAIVANGLEQFLENPVTTYLEDLGKITKRLRPLFKPEHSQIFLVEEDRLSEYNLIHGFDNLSMMNLFRAMTTLAVRGYSHGPRRTLSMEDGLSEDETHDFYMDFRPLGTDLKLLDPRSANAGRRSFLEANLFTYIGDGLQQDSKNTRNEHAIMKFEEAMELVSFLWSGGSLSARAYKELAEHCKLGPNDIHGRQKLDRLCVEQRLSSSMNEYMTTAPGLNRYYQSLTVVEKKAYLDLLLNVAFSPGESSEVWIEKSELNIVMMIMQYSESIMTRYNNNGDDILDTEEVMRAFPAFSGLIKKMAKALCAGDISTELAKDIFKYMVEKGEVPEQTAETWAEFQWRRWFWNVELDRLHVTKVFSSIIQTIIKPSTVHTKGQCESEEKEIPPILWRHSDSEGQLIGPDHP